MPETIWPLETAVNTFGAKPAIVSARVVLTFEDFGKLVRGIAGALRVAGIGPGDRLATAALPSANYIAALMACFRVGANACPINTRLPRKAVGEEVQRIQAMAFFVDEYFSMVQLENIPVLRIDHIVTEAAEEAAPDPPGSLHRTGTVIFTSGSSGHPKAALLTYANHYYNALASNENIPLGPGDRWLLSLPLFHVSGIAILFRCLIGGAAVVVPNVGESLEDAIHAHEVTHVSLVATQLFRMLQTKSGIEALKKTKAILLGGSSIPTALLRQSYELGLPVHTSYGLTEMASQVTTTRPGASLEELMTSGRQLTPDTVMISPKDEVLVRGRTLFHGYAHGVRFDLPVTSDGWFVTGDLGQFDRHGNLQIIGRRDNMFISGGENIQPEEIERHLGRLEGVVQALVVPVSCAEFGQRPVAFVRTDDVHPLDAETLAVHLKEALPSYKVPIMFLPWPEEGEQTSSKLSRGLFAELAEWMSRAKR